MEGNEEIRTSRGVSFRNEDSPVLARRNDLLADSEFVIDGDPLPESIGQGGGGGGGTIEGIICEDGVLYNATLNGTIGDPV